MAVDIHALELSQNRRTLAVIIWTALLAGFALGLYDLQFNTPVSVLTLFGLSLCCVPLLILNSRGHFQVAGLLLGLIVLIAITVNIFDGDGVRDPGILAYPIFILGGTLLFGKRAVPYFAAGAVVSITAVTYLETSGFVRPSIGPTKFEILVPFVTLLLAAAVIVWAILNNMERNLQRVRDSEAGLGRNYDLTLEAWATILERRDRETEGHTERVTTMTLQLAEALGLEGQSLVDVRRGALLHDIGKMGIPDSILHKRSSLTEEEWAVVKEHPTFAHELLAPITYLTAAVDIPWCHHEHWDGTGYPRGLTGEAIPLAARIFAIADVWDALTSDRPYRGAWPKDQALKHIRTLSGSHFDPRVVDAFLRLDPAGASKPA